MYEAFGLTVLSEISLPECTRITNESIPVDVEITFGDIPLDWDHEAMDRDYLIVRNNELMLTIHGVARYVIREGARILISPLPGSDEGKVRVYLLGTCMGVILMQRKILPLHGSAVVIDGKAYAFVGESGAGKSTIAAVLLNQGYQLLSDDVIAVSLSPDELPMVTPSYPQQKLWKESIDKLGMKSSEFRPLYQELTKYAVPVSDQFRNEPVPLAGVFEIVKTDREQFEIRHVQGIQRLPIFMQHTYRNFIVPRLGLERWHFAISSSIVSRIHVFQLGRPSVGFTAHELATEILSKVRKGA